MSNVLLLTAKEEKIRNFITMYAYLTLADMEEILSEQGFDQKAVKQIMQNLHGILTRHERLVVESVFSSIYLTH